MEEVGRGRLIFSHHWPAFFIPSGGPGDGGRLGSSHHAISLPEEVAPKSEVSPLGFGESQGSQNQPGPVVIAALSLLENVTLAKLLQLSEPLFSAL